jgi:hypothetical protein
LAELEQRKLDAEIAKEKMRLESEKEDKRFQEQRRLEAEAEKRKLDAETEAEKRKFEAETEQRRLEAEQLRMRLEAEKEERELNLKKLELERMEREKEKDRNFALEQKRLEIEANAIAQGGTYRPTTNASHGSGDEAGINARGIKNIFYNTDRFQEKIDDVDDFIYKFERKCELYNIQGEPKAIYFGDLLDGKALEAYKRMSNDERKDFEIMKAVILKTYLKNPDSYKKKFDDASMEVGESMQQFITRIQGFYLRWVEVAKIEKTFEGLFHEAVKSKIFNTVNSELCTHLKEKERECKDLEDLARYADYWIDARPNRQPGKQMKNEKYSDSFYNRKPFHNPKFQNQDNGNGSSQGSTNTIVKSIDGSQTKYNKPVKKCDNCGRDNHFTKDCRLKINVNNQGKVAQSFSSSNAIRQEQRPRSNECYFCGKSGHFAKDCAEKQNRVHSAALAMIVPDTRINFGVDIESRDKLMDNLVEVQIENNCCMDENHSYHEVDDIDQSYESDSDEVRMSVERALLVESKDYLPWVEGSKDGKAITVIRDTGCTTIMIRRSLVQDTELTGKQQLCHLADGTIISCDEAKISINTPFYSGTTKALCLKNPIYDVLVGNISGASTGEEILAKGDFKDLEKFNTDVIDCVNVTSIESSLAELNSDELVDQSVNRNECCVTTRLMAANEGKALKPLKVKEINIITSNDMKAEQLADESLTKFWDLATSEATVKVFKGTTTEFRVKNGILYRVYQCKTYNQGNKCMQMMVPKDYRLKLMELAHSNPFAGHLGRKATEDRIVQNFFWPGCFGDIDRFCKSCDICQRTTPAGRVKKVPLGKMPTIDVPFKRVCIDLIGPMVKSDRGHQWVLTLIDEATRYPECVALKKIDTSSVADALLSIFSRVGIPAELRSDQGKQFTSEQMKEVCRLFSIKQLFNTPYHPQNTGVVERFNGVIKSMIKKLAEERIQDWDRFLDPALFAYRSSIQRGTGFSPFELVYGRTVRGPLEIVKELWTKEGTTEEVKNTYQYVLDLREKIEQTCKLASQKLEENAHKNKIYFDKKAQHRSFKIGDKVLLLLTNSSNKLQLQWKGPFDILERVGKYDYRIQMVNKTRTFHANMLKKYEEREEQFKNDKLKEVQSRSEAEECAGVAVVDEHILLHEGIDEIELPVYESQQTETYKDVIIDPNLIADKRAQLEELIFEFQDIFSDVPGKTNLIEVDIKMEKDEDIKLRPFPVPLALRDKLNEEIDSMLKLGIIEPSNAKYASPLVMIKKADGVSYRICTDFRVLNKLITSHQEPINNIDEIWSRLNGSRWYSKMDLSKGFWQLPLKEECRDVTSFISPRGLFRYKYLPFGLSISPAWFTKMMRKLLDGAEQVEHFFDDILAHTESWEEHLRTLREVFTRVRSANLTLRPAKCFFGNTHIEFLGHMMSEQGLIPSKDKIWKIVKMEAPTDKKSLQSFLGCLGYHRKFIANYSTIAKPLTDLTQKNKVFFWGKEQEDAFNLLKEKLNDHPILIWPDVNKEFFIQTDASGVGIGGVLLQVKEGNKHPVMYISRKLLPCEQRYSTIERELLAIIWAIQKFALYLYGKRFYLETDHEPLKYLSTNQPKNHRLLRWALILQQYDFVINSVKGKDNVIADCLSRLV